MQLNLPIDNNIPKPSLKNLSLFDTALLWLEKNKQDDDCLSWSNNEQVSSYSIVFFHAATISVSHPEAPHPHKACNGTSVITR